ncbi:hypothetical protein FB567DRAFT_534374 [Paraphoma chrysanthemicola]|uniref:Uncharacterized protein n=1 Tax=Paraphoma chrysanthemicola TaxID=798071 RepID=A0A8K0VTY0_9PLEO|nr:hypothetical protein FB567DRAFT_534374 [Paraphoma chrysanthemicola]
MEFSLPYLILEEVESSAETPATKQSERDGNFATDLAFLRMEGRQSGRPAKFILREAHETAAIFGFDDHDWTGYAFSKHDSDALLHMQTNQDDDADTDRESDRKVEDEDQGEEEDEEDEDDDNIEPEEDLFASHGSGKVIDGKNAKWNPRIYFLCVAAIRVEFVAGRHTYITQKLDDAMMAWMHDYIFSPAGCNGRRDGSDNKQLFENMMQIKRLLHGLRDYLKDALEAWNDFDNEDDGDVSFFRDLTDLDATRALQGMRRSFKSLKPLMSKLDSLEKSCKEGEEALTLRMKVEENDRSRQAHDLSMSAYRLNRRATECTIKSQKAAEETSLTTRVNVQLLLTTTPLALALQYFCADSNIFSISRTPKTFAVCLFVLWLSLPLLTFILQVIDRQRRNFVDKVLQWMGRGNARDRNAIDLDGDDYELSTIKASRCERVIPV